MKIGILGSGVVSKALAAGFIKHGNDVMVGSREPAKLDEWKAELGNKLQTGHFSQTAAFGEIVVLAVKGTVAESAIKLAGIETLAGKTIIDATNPIEDAAPANGVLKFFTNNNNSLMEQLQSLAPDAHFVKAFNSVGSSLMVNPSFDSKPTMFICGNNENAKSETAEILDKFGWETEDMGAIEAARAIEPLCMLWCIPGICKNSWTHAFKLLKM